MKREIKFRVWNVKRTGFSQGEFALIDGEFDFSENRFIALQFTGLLDKNGKEIYEGDIVKNDGATWEVLFNTGCFAGKCLSIPHGERDFHLALRAIKEIEIIGNIYENPELLKT